MNTINLSTTNSLSALKQELPKTAIGLRLGLPKK